MTKKMHSYFCRAKFLGLALMLLPLQLSCGASQYGQNLPAPPAALKCDPDSYL